MPSADSAAWTPCGWVCDVFTDPPISVFSLRSLISLVGHKCIFVKTHCFSMNVCPEWPSVQWGLCLVLLSGIYHNDSWLFWSKFSFAYFSYLQYAEDLNTKKRLANKALTLQKNLHWKSVDKKQNLLKLWVISEIFQTSPSTPQLMLTFLKTEKLLGLKDNWLVIDSV